MQAAGVGIADFDLEGLRRRIGKMNEQALLRFGQASRFMCSPRANLGKPPLDCYVMQLQEARTEFRVAFQLSLLGRASLAIACCQLRQYRWFWTQLDAIPTFSLADLDVE
jgi:hypothetical protein